MLYYWLLFFFIAFGSKLVLASAMIYLLLPADRVCSRCDGETLLLHGGRVGRLASLLLFRRVQHRWCPRCGWQGLARRQPPPREPAGALFQTISHTRR